jgi:hypothetical protein
MNRKEEQLIFTNPYNFEIWQVPELADRFKKRRNHLNRLRLFLFYLIIISDESVLIAPNIPYPPEIFVQYD